ncbi:MAG: hypothetical protein SO170_07000 [Butyribacter sp.]|nr:hypothetical protein [bacterium]MDY3854681.1 hypothetical protein [Butyribacter sp.]
MKETSYERGNYMTFPLELTEAEDREMIMENKYLYPAEVLEIQGFVEEACDRMEYDGSLMYDEYPDKVSIERMARKICRECKCNHQEEISNRWMQALVQVMLCKEMSYRRRRHHMHKRNLGRQGD